jgi:pyruvate/2-oxoglutarate dehydrogenase complex dihydrolipoamide dehydrogenase (E3) component
MDVETFDVIVIGGGSAGYAAARTAREKAEKVAIIDDAEELGGLCILRGCMPSKTLIYSAEVLHQAQMGELFGLHIPEARANMAQVHARKVRMIDDFKSYRQEQLASDRFTLIRERARFVDHETLELAPSGRQLKATTFIISTGSVVNQPPIPGLDLPGIWTSDDVLELNRLPESVVMLGGGIVACELAQFLQRMGTQVNLIQRSPRILKEMSEEASAVIEQAMENGGMKVFTDTQLKEISTTENGFKVVFEQGEEQIEIETAHVCNALGRRPNVDALNLDAAGIEQRENGQIVVDEFQRTTNKRIYAAGDVTGPYEIVHLAIMQGELAAKHARGEDGLKPVDLENRTGVVFTDPQVATAGLSLAECAEAGYDVVAADYPFNDHGKSMLMEANYGYVKAWADRKTGRLLGAECVGKDAGELIHSMAVGISLQAQVSAMVGVHWYHPTLSEIWSYPLEDILEEL